MVENLAVSIKGTGPSDCHFSGSILDLQQDALQRRYILAVIPFFCVCLQKVAFEYKKKGIFSLLYTEVKETNENKDLNIVVCPRQCGSNGAEESGMGGVGS